MLAAPHYTGQLVKPLRVAIVEDNATARTNLRSHLMGIDHFDVASYSNGSELKNGLRVNNFDLVLMDYHLGQSKNGVEWITTLLDRNLFKPSTGLVFITSDGTPQTIGQILDLHPDFILIKPYTIKSFSVNLVHYLKLRKVVLPVLQHMNQDNNAEALKLISKLIEQNTNKRFANDLLKLKGRLLLIEKQYPQAISLYSSVLEKSSNVLWAHWGLIKSEFFTGQWEQCQNMLNDLISRSLTKDKAYEWLASVSIGKAQYNEAEIILDNIKESELTIQATRLKVLALTMQKKNDEAKILLEKKIQNNLSIKDRMSEYALELARFHIQMAETLVKDDSVRDKHSAEPTGQEKEENLSTARKLIGKAARTINDRQSQLQKDYMLALAYTVEGDKDRAKKMMEKSGEFALQTNLQVGTMIDAVKVWFGIGQNDKANAILQECDDYLMHKSNHVEKHICAKMISTIEENHHLQKDRALQSNDKGNELYKKGEFLEAINYFFNSYTLFPGIPAFSLNLLQCMALTHKQEFKGLHAEALYKELTSVSLSPKNQIKLDHIKTQFGF